MMFRFGEKLSSEVVGSWLRAEELFIAALGKTEYFVFRLG